VVGYLLIGLGALWALTCPSPHRQATEQSAVSLVAPYVPVLVVLAVTGVQLLRGRQMEPVSWIMALALALLVLGREALRMLERLRQDRNVSMGSDGPQPVPSLESVPIWREL